MTPAQCPRRAIHATKLSRLLEAYGYRLARCPCGMRYPLYVDREAN